MEDGSVVHMYTFMLHVNCRARLLLLFAQVSKFNSQSLNSETKGAELTLKSQCTTTTHQQLLKAGGMIVFTLIQLTNQMRDIYMTF